jgi:hypothetical protein
MTDKKAPSMEEVVRENARKAVANRIDMVASALDSIPGGRLPEEIFVKYFLPLFCGETQNPDFAQQWISVAGSPTSEVAVFDDKGEVLFNVPAWLDTTVINSASPLKGSVGILNIVQNAELVGNNIKAQGVQAFTRNMAVKARELIKANEAEPSVFRDRWLAILKRYDRLEDNTPSASEQTAAGLSEDDMEF